MMTAVLFVAFNTVKAQEDKLYFNKSKSEVMALLTLDEEVIELRSGVNHDSVFYYAVFLDNVTGLGYYFDESDTCNTIIYTLDFDSYRQKLKDFTEKSKDEDSNIKAITANGFILKDSLYAAEFSVEDDNYTVRWYNMMYDYDFSETSKESQN